MALSRFLVFFKVIALVSVFYAYRPSEIRQVVEHLLVVGEGQRVVSRNEVPGLAVTRAELHSGEGDSVVEAYHRVVVQFLCIFDLYRVQIFVGPIGNQRIRLSCSLLLQEVDHRLAACRVGGLERGLAESENSA